MTTTASQGYHQPSSIEEVRTLWIGDLQYWVDENYLTHCFAHTGEVVSIKIIRNKITGQPEGYGFVEFRPDAGPEHSIFVGDLAPDVTDYLLQETFRTHYPSVRGAKVVTDPNTGRSKGYGFVKFSDETERNRAMTEMNGVYCSTKAIYPIQAYTTPVNAVPPDYDMNNTTIFVGNLDLNVTEEELKQTFLQFGEIVSVKIQAGKGCGFVQFGTRTSAEEAIQRMQGKMIEAIQRMQGKMIGQQVVRISWGRSLTARQDGWGAQMDPSQWSAYYGYGQGYEAYAYGAAQDPSLYAYGTYAGYTQYPQQVEGAQDMASMTIPNIEPREELYDPLTVPDVDKLNAAYLSVHGSAILGRSLWQKTSPFTQAA
ncbi:hypothetical protein K1719_006370 [Acacia pycnantha]|nr:hypothetical protein K1719_006370 [Acacia pycnantha]